jgi:hypothetical protein
MDGLTIKASDPFSEAQPRRASFPLHASDAEFPNHLTPENRARKSKKHLIRWNIFTSSFT